MRKLTQEDFPDICAMCEQCIQSFRNAIQAHIATQIKDTDMLHTFVETAMLKLLQFLQEREAQECHIVEEHKHTDGSQHHEHHTHNEHHQLEEDIRRRLTDIRRDVFITQKEERKFKFNRAEYKFN